MLKSNTCLAVIRHSGKLYFAGDRRVSWGMHKAQKGVRPKISLRDGILYAGTGVSAMCDEITDLFNPPNFKNSLAANPNMDPFLYMNNVFMPALLEHLRTKRFVKHDERGLTTNDKGKSYLESSILIGLDTSLFEVDIGADAIIADSIDAPYASGCGGMYAYGAILALQDTNLSPEDILTKALKIAAKVSPGCDANIDVLHN